MIITSIIKEGIVFGHCWDDWIGFIMAKREIDQEAFSNRTMLFPLNEQSYFYEP